MISATENSNKFPKTRFWKEISVEDVITLEPTIQATLVLMNRCECVELNPRVGAIHKRRVLE